MEGFITGELTLRQNEVTAVCWLNVGLGLKEMIMTSKEREAMKMRMWQGMRGLSEEEIAERQRKAWNEMRPMTPKEIAERQRDGLQNIWGKEPGEA